MKIAKITLYFGILKIKESSFSSILKTFQNSNEQVISKRELIFLDRTHTYLFCASISRELQIVTGLLVEKPF